MLVPGRFGGTGAVGTLGATEAGGVGGREMRFTLGLDADSSSPSAVPSVAFGEGAGSMGRIGTPIVLFTRGITNFGGSGATEGDGASRGTA